MATKTADIIVQAREMLIEPKPKFWSQDELKGIARLGYLDLWGAILDLHGEHYIEVNTSVTLKSGMDRLSDVPVRCFRVLLIEPRDTTTESSTTARDTVFVPRKYNSNEFAAARSTSAIDPSQAGTIYYTVSGVGAPIDAPQILTAPLLSSSMDLRLVYNPTIEIGDYNPIPGESDAAIKAWIIAFARAKEREDRNPDPGWLSVYATEKQSILTRLTPRQEQEPEYVEDFWPSPWSY